MAGVAFSGMYPTPSMIMKLKKYGIGSTSLNAVLEDAISCIMACKGQNYNIIDILQALDIRNVKN